MFKIDGDTYNMFCSIERTAEIRASELSGMLMDKTYFNDVIATYLSYTVSIVVPIGQETEYTNLYELLTDPIAEHTFEMPYNQGTVTIKGRITEVTDRYYRESRSTGKKKKIWRGTQFTVISNYPTKVG